VERAVGERLRFDVVVADLTWNDYAVEYSFDGLDVLDMLRRARRPTPMIFAAQGHGVELDHLDEAVEQPEVVGIYRKATGPQPLIDAPARRIFREYMNILEKAEDRPPRVWPGRSRRAGPLITKRSPARRMLAMTPPRNWSIISGRSLRTAVSTTSV